VTSDDRAGRVLVVDDEDNITFLLDSALRHFGFDVRVAATGRGALREAEAFNPDVVLLDVMLPDLDGFEIVRRMRMGGAKVSRPLPHRPRHRGGQGPRPQPRR